MTRIRHQDIAGKKGQAAVEYLFAMLALTFAFMGMYKIFGNGIKDKVFPAGATLIVRQYK